MHCRRPNQKLTTNESKKVRATIKRFILTVNYITAVLICLTLLTQTQIPIAERAVYGFGAIFLGMGIRWGVKAFMPPDQGSLDGN